MNASDLAIAIQSHGDPAAITKEQWTAYVKLFRELDDVGRLECWRLLSDVSADDPEERARKYAVALAVHPHFCKLVLDVFHMPMGEAGKGVVPRIPPGVKVDK